jgi:hypothetical protein
MPEDSRRADGSVVGDLLLVANLLENPQLADLYTYILREDPVTVREVLDAFDLFDERIHALMSRLKEMGVIEITMDSEPPKYRATAIELSLTTDQGGGTYTVTPALVEAVGRRLDDPDIDTYIDQHGIGGLSTALTYAVERERSNVTHRLMARDLDIAPLEAEVILQALRPVVHEHYDIENSGASIEDVVTAEDPAVDDE